MVEAKRVSAPQTFWEGLSPTRKVWDDVEVVPTRLTARANLNRRCPPRRKPTWKSALRSRPRLKFRADAQPEGPSQDREGKDIGVPVVAEILDPAEDFKVPADLA